jgi:hypothetical protein
MAEGGQRERFSGEEECKPCVNLFHPILHVQPPVHRVHFSRTISGLHLSRICMASPAGASVGGHQEGAGWHLITQSSVSSSEAEQKL